MPPSDLTGPGVRGKGDKGGEGHPPRVEPGVSSSRLDLTLDFETQQAGGSGACPPGAEMGGGSVTVGTGLQQQD